MDLNGGGLQPTSNFDREFDGRGRRTTGLEEDRVVFGC